MGPQHCGLVAIVGKPNVGKSTLLNALVGQKISITSRKAQTTRHRITGMRTIGATQFVFVDTPGFQTLHGNALNKSLNKTVQGAVGDVDLILFVVEAGSFTPADERVLKLLGKGIPTILLANKLDSVGRRADVAPWLQQMQAKHEFAEFVPMSAKNAKDVERLFGICEKYLPEQPWFYDEDELTDRSEKFLAAEIVREQDGFITHGVAHLKPMTLKQVAEAIDMHESTVSRVTSNKYMATPRGLYEMKYFFTTAIASATGGGDHSAEAVRHRIKQLIDAEPANDILSDDTIAEMLRKEQGLSLIHI